MRMCLLLGSKVASHQAAGEEGKSGLEYTVSAESEMLKKVDFVWKKGSQRGIMLNVFRLL